MRIKNILAAVLSWSACFINHLLRLNGPLNKDREIAVKVGRIVYAYRLRKKNGEYITIHQIGRDRLFRPIYLTMGCVDDEGRLLTQELAKSIAHSLRQNPKLALMLCRGLWPKLRVLRTIEVH